MSDITRLADISKLRPEDQKRILDSIRPFTTYKPGVSISYRIDTSLSLTISQHSWGDVSGVLGPHMYLATNRCLTNSDRFSLRTWSGVM